MKKNLRKLLILLSILNLHHVMAQSWELGGGVGGLGAQGDSSDANIGFTGMINIHPFTWSAFQLDAIYASIEDESFLAFTPSARFYIAAMDEYNFGPMIGVGFYKWESDEKTRFGMNYGFFGEMALSESFLTGFQFRWHDVFGYGLNSWSAMLTLNMKFEIGGAW